MIIVTVMEDEARSIIRMSTHIKETPYSLFEFDPERRASTNI